MMAEKWKPSNKVEARKKASMVARFYHAHFNFMGCRPILSTIALHFGRSSGWARIYLNYARELGFIRGAE